MADDEHIAVTSTVWVNVIEITQERDELRLEVERAWAEVQRLRTEHTYAVADVRQLEAENKRLTNGWDQTLNQLENAHAEIREIREMVDRQAEDEGLWFIRVTASEAYLQQELRSLHDRIERLARALI